MIFLKESPCFTFIERILIENRLEKRIFLLDLARLISSFNGFCYKHIITYGGLTIELLYLMIIFHKYNE